LTSLSLTLYVSLKDTLTARARYDKMVNVYLVKLFTVCSSFCAMVWCGWSITTLSQAYKTIESTFTKIRNTN